MPIQIIDSSQAPDAKPIGKSTTLSTLWQSIIEVPSYRVPEESFGGGTVVVPGVAEIISPLVVTNKVSGTVNFSIRVWRESTQSYFTVVNQLPVAQNDAVFFPLNGQFIYTGDILEMSASANSSLDIMISYTIGQAEQDDVV
jgi:hypothetical protein